jgi:tetratricopeptide (TPR) repeat protein
MRNATATVLMLVGAIASAGEPTEDRERAKAYFAAGVEAYDQANYEVALREFQHAHALSHSAPLYFNMAACEEHLDHFQAAALLLRQYLIEKPDADDRANVEARVRTLEARDERLHKPSAPPPPVEVKPAPPPAAPVERARPRLKYTWALVGATGAIAIAAVGVGAYTIAHHNDLKRTCGATDAGCSPAQVSGLQSTAIATDVLIGAAAAAAVATVVAAIVETRRGRAHAAAATSVALAGDGVRF